MLISRVLVGTREFPAKIDTCYLDSNKGNNYKMHVIEASLESGLHFGHLDFNFLNGVESTNQVFCSILRIKKCIIL